MNEEVKSFLEKNRIELIKNKPIINEKIDAKYYIENLSRVHEIFIGDNNSIRFKFPNNTWRLFQNFKLWSNRTSRIEYNNDIFTLISSEAKESIGIIENMDYKNLIRRAMDRNEVCIKRIYFGLKEYDYRIKILKSEKIAFGMVEDDYYEYFKRLKGNSDIDLNELILFALESEGLGEESYAYIKALLIYPHNSMKYLQNVYVKGTEIDFDKLIRLAKKDFLI